MVHKQLSRIMIRTYPATTPFLSLIRLPVQCFATKYPGGMPNGVVVVNIGGTNYAYVAVESDNQPTTDDFVRVYDMSAYSYTDIPIASDAFPYGIAVTPNNDYVYVALGYDNASGPGAVGIIRTSDNTLIHNFQIAGSNYTSFGIAITPDGNTVYVTLVHSASGIGQVAFFPADGASHSLASINNVSVGYVPGGIAITPDSGTVYVANYGVHSGSPTHAPSISYFATLGERLY